MHMYKVDTTLVLLCTAVHACFASSLTATAVAVRPNPPETSIIRLLRLFFGNGFVGALVAYPLRCCGIACLRRHARQVQGAVRRNNGERLLKEDIIGAYSQRRFKEI